MKICLQARIKQDRLVGKEKRQGEKEYIEDKGEEVQESCGL